MLVDIHTNLFWYPDHLSDEFVASSWAAKRAKMRLTADVHRAVDDESGEHDSPSVTPEQAIAGLWEVNDVVKGTGSPTSPEEAIHRIIYENWKQFLSFD